MKCPNKLCQYPDVTKASCEYCGARIKPFPYPYYPFEQRLLTILFSSAGAVIVVLLLIGAARIGQINEQNRQHTATAVAQAATANYWRAQTPTATFTPTFTRTSTPPPTPTPRAIPRLRFDLKQLYVNNNGWYSRNDIFDPNDDMNLSFEWKMFNERGEQIDSDSSAYQSMVFNDSRRVATFNDELDDMINFHWNYTVQIRAVVWDSYLGEHIIGVHDFTLNYSQLNSGEYSDTLIFNQLNSDYRLEFEINRVAQ